jgi:thiol-disulfide isomerase/thioredoxin
LIETKARHRRGIPAVILTLAVAAQGGGAALAQMPGVQIQAPGDPVQQNMPRSWYRNFDYGIEIDGQMQQDIGLFQVVGKPYMLVYGPGMEKAWVLSMRPKNEVRSVRTGAITVKNDIEVILAESDFLAEQPSPWANDGQTAVVFYGGSSRIRIARVPELVGEISTEAIFETNPLYRRGMEQYTPDQSAIAKLKEVSGHYLIEVWFGSWCPHCQRVVPRFLKVVQAAGNPNVEVLYHAVPRQFGTYQPAVQKEVNGLPTFIIMKDGREFTRFKGAGAPKSIEAEMAEILNSPTRPTGR